MITLVEARARVGDKVVYRPHPGAAPEEGVVTSVTMRHVFVRYGSDGGAKATDPADLSWLAGSSPEAEVARDGRTPGHPAQLAELRWSDECGWKQVVDDVPCTKPPGHTDPHRVRSPYGDGRWTEHDVTTGVEVARGGSW